MSKTRRPVVHLCFGGPQKRIVVGKQSYLFEMHSHCGPMPCDWKGNERVVKEGSKFWEAVSQWAQQGERVDRFGTCVYDSAIPLGAMR